jgi:patatin-like phospholipase/acyl hydrolase
MGGPLRILSLDGGGVRGISSLYILKELMAQAARQQAVDRPNEPRSVPRPCEVFDMICGTSTGGLIALMLGRLEMVSPYLKILLPIVRLSMRQLKAIRSSRSKFSLPSRETQ